MSQLKEQPLDKDTDQDPGPGQPSSAELSAMSMQGLNCKWRDELNPSMSAWLTAALLLSLFLAFHLEKY